MSPWGSRGWREILPEMPSVRHIEPVETSRRWLAWLARAMVPAVVLFAGMFGESFALRAIAPDTSRDAAETAMPRPASEGTRRQEGLTPKSQSSVATDFKIRRKQPAAPDTDIEPPAPAPAAVLIGWIVVGNATFPASTEGRSRPYPSAAPRAPPV